MLQLLSGSFRSFDGKGVWPQSKIVGALKRRYERVDTLGEEQGYTLFGVTDHGVAFVVALQQADSAKGRVSGVGFLARFTGQVVERATVEALNRNLHLSVVSLESDGDVYLLAAIETDGAFREETFTLILEAWRRDMMLVLHALSGLASIAAAFPAAGLRRAQSFAINRAPDNADDAGALLKTFLGGGAQKALCAECSGRGRMGLVSRVCRSCDGAGLIEARPTNG